MISKVEAIIDHGGSIEQYDKLNLSLRDPSSGYIIKDIEGLDPVNATVVSSNFASMDGEQYHSSRRDKRNIVIKLDLKPEYANKTAAELRKGLYDFFMPKNHVRLRFFLDAGGASRIIYGRVESFVAPLFTKDPQATISLLCFNSDFRDLNSTTIAGNTTGSEAEGLLDYIGSVETGISLRLAVNRDLPGFTFYHRSTDDVMKILTFDSPLIAGDVLHLSTVPGDKSAVRNRGADWRSVLYGVHKTSDWIKLFPGLNYIRIFASGEPIPYTIEYTNRYGGF